MRSRRPIAFSPVSQPFYNFSSCLPFSVTRLESFLTSLARCLLSLRPTILYAFSCRRLRNHCNFLLVALRTPAAALDILEHIVLTMRVLWIANSELDTVALIHCYTDWIRTTTYVARAPNRVMMMFLVQQKYEPTVTYRLSKVVMKKLAPEII